MAELPCAARVLTPVGGVVAEAEREAGTSAACGFDQREAEVEVARAQVDLFAGRAPVSAGWADADLARVDAAGGRRGDSFSLIMRGRCQVNPLRVRSGYP